MRRTIIGIMGLGITGALLAGSVSFAVAQTSGGVPTSAVPPSGRGDHSVSTNTTNRTPSGTNSGASKEGVAHNTGDVANGPTPPRQTGSQPSTTPPSGPASATIVPGPAYNSGSANVGNSNENNGMIGSQGAGASATMQSGHSANR